MDDYHAKIIAKNLRYYMYEREKTQAMMAKDLGINKATISCWMNGTRIPRMDALERVCNYLHITKSQLIEERQEEAQQDDKVKEEKVRIPVYGQVAAGIPMEMIEDIEDYEDIPKAMTRGGKEYFALKIHGDSMEPKISDGDVIIVRKQPTAGDGELVVVSVGNENATCKRIKHYASGLSLISDNPSHPPMFFNEEEIVNKPVTIMGKVVELRAKFE